MTNLLTLLAECERWLGVEPLGEAQWAEATELRERVRAVLADVSSRVECRLCGGDPDARVWLTRNDGSQEPVCCPHPVVDEPPADPRDLRAVSAEFLAEVARKREKETDP